MTPERAGELAEEFIDANDDLSHTLNTHLIAFILQACAEQRESDIAIAETYAKNAGNMYARRSGRSVAAAIRGAK